jgi:hypothetical protein
MRVITLLLIAALPATGLMSCGGLTTPTLQAIDQSTQAPLVDHVTPGAVVELWIGPALVATSGPVGAGSTGIRIPLPYRLSPAQVVRARQRLGWFGWVTSGFSNAVVVENNYVTNRYDNARSGWNPNETALTVSSVRTRLARVCDHPVDAPIRAQPLYVQDVDIPGQGRHNVVFAATQGDQIWAFDADGCAPSTQTLWGPRSLLAPGEIPPGTGNVPAKCSLNYGVWSTPVIDRTTNTMYVVAAAENTTTQAIFFRLHALDIRTGQDRNPAKPAVVIDGSTVQFTHGTVTTTLDPSIQQNRPGLLLDRGVVYLGFGSCGDVGSPYHGWILAYNADLPGNPTFLNQLGVFNTSADATGGCNTSSGTPPCFAGVWQSGLGLAADDDGTVYAITGNGNFDPTKGWFGNTLLKLRLPPPGSTNKQMQVVGSFTPFDWQTTYEPGDQDFGAGGPVLLSIGARHFVLAGGKPHESYLIDRDCTSCNGTPTWCNPAAGTSCTGDNPNLVLQTLTQVPQGSVAGPAWYTGPQSTKVFWGYNHLPITSYDFQAAPTPQLTNQSLAPDAAPVTAPIPAVSSSRSSPGTGVVWAVFHPSGAGTLRLTLHAYDADNVADNLFSAAPQSSLDIGPWTFGTATGNLGNSFQVPTVIHGRVYCGSQDHLVVFGLRRRPVCSFLIDCGGAVTFHCQKVLGLDVLQLERKQGDLWKTVTDSSSMRDLAQFVQLWNYPNSNTATFRVCSTSEPDDCTEEFSIRIPLLACRAGIGDCGRPGKPPCFLSQTWPASIGPEGPGERRREKE